MTQRRDQVQIFSNESLGILASDSASKSLVIEKYPEDTVSVYQLCVSLSRAEVGTTEDHK